MIFDEENWKKTTELGRRKLIFGQTHMKLAVAMETSKMIDTQLMSFKKTLELLAEAFLADLISDEEFVLLYDCSNEIQEVLNLCG